MIEYNNLKDTLFWFSYSVMLDHSESISMVEDRIQKKIILPKKLWEEFNNLVINPKINWIEFVVHNELISKFQAEQMGNLKCKEYVNSILNNFISEANYNNFEEE